MSLLACCALSCFKSSPVYVYTFFYNTKVLPFNKLQKFLSSYIPSPLSNGDTVQFGEIFGIFQLLEDESDLPMTQAIDIPDTPICTRGISRFNKAGITTVPESPDVSDRVSNLFPFVLAYL